MGGKQKPPQHFCVVAFSDGKPDTPPPSRRQAFPESALGTAATAIALIRGLSHPPVWTHVQQFRRMQLCSSRLLGYFYDQSLQLGQVCLLWVWLCHCHVLAGLCREPQMWIRKPRMLVCRTPCRAKTAVMDFPSAWRSRQRPLQERLSLAQGFELRIGCLDQRDFAVSLRQGVRYGQVLLLLFSSRRKFAAQNKVHVCFPKQGEIFE
jgi:hypothetical protein